MIVDINRFRDVSRKFQTFIVIAGLMAATILSVLVPNKALAAPALMERELQSSSAVPSDTGVTLTWVFDTTSDTANVDHIEIEFCDSPLSSCTNVNGASNAGTDYIPVLPASPTATLTNFTSNGNTASRVDGRQAATASSANQITIDKTTADTGTSLNEAQISIGGFTNDDEANRSYYTRMRLYSDAGTTLVWEGVFAQSTSQTLTVNARVQERLDFCVGSTAVNDATTSVGDACVDVTGNTVDIGNIESGQTNISPVTTVNGGSNENGLAMIRTNAVNGAVVDYRALQNSSSGRLKVAGAACVSATATTDQCFNSADADDDNSNGATAQSLTAGTERFGMTIAGINCGSATAYTCTFTAGTYNLQRDAEYDGNGANTFVTDTNQTNTATNGAYAWLDSGAVDRIASSAGSTVKVIDDEAMILKFAATAGITTPTGAYTVQADFIATTTF